MARTTKYLTLLGTLEKELCTLTPGTGLPSEENLAERYQVSKPTLRRALLELAERGVITKNNGTESIVSGSSLTIRKEVIFLCGSIPFFGNTIEAVCDFFAVHNYFPSIVPLSGDERAQARIIASVIARNPAGVIVYTHAHISRELTEAFASLSRIPSVYLIRLPEGISGNLAGFDMQKSLRRILHSFYEKGCRKFAFFAASGLVHFYAEQERYGAFEKTLKQHFLKPKEPLILRLGASEEAKEEFFELFRSDKRPDAVCCANDECVGQLLSELERRRIPTDGLYLSGFDNLSAASFFRYDFMTIDIPLKELGETAAELLLRQIENPNLAHSRKIIHADVKEIKSVSN